MAEGRLKIVVFGSFNAGKSSFIQALDPKSRHIEAASNEGPTTVAFDFGRLTVRDRAVYLFGTPGQERFEFVRQVLSRGMDGAIIMVDATKGSATVLMRCPTPSAAISTGRWSSPSLP